MDIDRRLDLIEARLNRMLDPAPPPAPVEIVRARCKTTIPERPDPVGDEIELDSGTAEIWRKDPEDGKMKPTGEIVDVEAWHKEDISVDVFIQIAPVEDGMWTVIAADCED